MKEHRLDQLGLEEQLPGYSPIRGAPWVGISPRSLESIRRPTKTSTSRVEAIAEAIASRARRRSPISAARPMRRDSVGDLGSLVGCGYSHVSGFDESSAVAEEESRTPSFLSRHFPGPELPPVRATLQSLARERIFEPGCLHYRRSFGQPDLRRRARRRR